MSNERVTKVNQKIATRRPPPKPLFELGQIVGTPAALAHLEQSRLRPLALLAFHVTGDWGEVGKEDAAANDQAVIDGSRILSAWTVEGEKVWIITEAVDDSGHRAATTILLPHEY